MYKDWNRKYKPEKEEIDDNLVIGSRYDIINPFIQYYDLQRNTYVHDPNLPDYFFPCDLGKLPPFNPYISAFYVAPRPISPPYTATVAPTRSPSPLQLTGQIQ